MSALHRVGRAARASPEVLPSRRGQFYPVSVLGGHPVSDCIKNSLTFCTSKHFSLSVEQTQFLSSIFLRSLEETGGVSQNGNPNLEELRGC